jgi:hypothetical protein
MSCTNLEQIMYGRDKPKTSIMLCKNCVRQDILDTVCAVEREEGERWLTPVVGEKEIRGRGEATPGAADRAAAKDVLGPKADKDLPS